MPIWANSRCPNINCVGYNAAAGSALLQPKSELKSAWLMAFCCGTSCFMYHAGCRFQWDQQEQLLPLGNILLLEVMKLL